MKRRYKISIALGVVVLLLVGFGVYFVTDEARQRAILIRAIEASIGGTVQIEGDVSFSVGRISSFSAERVTFALPDAGTSGTVGRISVSVDTLSVVDGPLFIEELLVEQGAVRVDGLPGLANAPEEAVSGEVTLPILKRIEIINTRLDISATTSDEYSTLSIDDLTVLQVGERRELEIAGAGLFDDITLALTGGVGPFEETQDGAVNTPVRLTFSSSAGTATVVGTIFDMFQDAQLDVAVTANAISGGVLDRVTEPLALQNFALSLTGKLLGPIARPRITELETSIEGDGVLLELTGEIGDATYGAGIDVGFRGSIGGDFLRRLVADLPQSLGLEQIDASGRVKGAIARLDLSELDVGADLAGQARLSANGQITVADVLGKFDVPDADLAIRLSAPTAQLLGDLIDDNLATMGTIEGEARLAGSDGRLALEGLDLLAGRDGPVRMRITGRIPWVAGDFAAGLEAAEILGVLTGDDVKDLSPILGFDLPTMGPIELRTAMGFRGDDLFFTDTSIAVSGPDDLRVIATGSARIHDLPGESFLDTIDTTVQITSATSTAFFRTLDIDLPELGATEGSVKLTGDEDTLSLGSIDLRFRDPNDLNVAVTGKHEVDLLNDGIVRDLDFNVTAEAPSVASIAQRADVDLPELGPVQVTARLLGHDPADAIAVETFLVSVGPETEPVLSIAGTFDNLLTPQSGVMDAAVRADGVTLFKAMDWPSIIGLETIRADMQLTARDGSLGIEHLLLESENSEAISLTVRGAIDDLLNFDQVDLDIVLSAPDAQIFDPALQDIIRPTGALNIDGKIVIIKPDIRFEGDLRLGDNDIDAKLSGSTAGVRPSLSGQIAARRLELDEFGIGAEDRESIEPAKPDDPGKQRDYVFSKEPLPFDSLFAIDLDLALTADGGRGLNYDFDTFQAQLRLQDGRLSLDPFKIIYEDGNVEASGEIDASVDPPVVKLRLRGSDFELDELLLYVQDEPTAGGELHGDFDLKSRGSSPRELAKNLSGTADIALDKGRVNGINLHVLSTETFQYLGSLPKLAETTEIQCAIARFEIESGVATSQALLIATPRMTLSGTGAVDFGNEEMDFTFSADPKTFVPVIFKKPVRIHGKLSDPKYSAGSSESGVLGGFFGKIAGFVAAPIVFAPANAAGNLVGLLSEPGEESPCLTGEKSAKSE